MSLKTIVRDLTTKNEDRSKRYRSIIADYADIDLLMTYRDRDDPEETYTGRASKSYNSSLQFSKTIFIPQLGKNR